ncbi:MAG: 23S rRNA (adenine(2503)-C(2))-methyltransferase RlmN [Verrucomicrobia bacterium]|nr:23S rRNA (adenine(2503)-C(2))-methyltransferase RlmN [Verrucomicrobiota bacterium]
MQSIHSMSLEELGKLISEEGEKPFRAKQIFHWVYEKKECDWEKMTDLNKSLRARLKDKFSLSTITQKNSEVSKDEETIKFLWELFDGKLVESVLIISKDRRTVCVSSQVGCPARCAFCASGKEGLLRNLSASEIYEQVYQIDRFLHAKGERVSHVVFMGMGEPFENYDNVLKAIHLLNDPLRLNISQRRITVSTVGVVEGIRRFIKEDLSVNLVLSLHAPNQHIRKKIIPYSRKYPLEDILSAMVAFSRETKRDITYEYTLIEGINDRPEHAEELALLLKGQQCSVNLIPYNPVPGLNLNRPEKESIEEFRRILLSYDIVTTWRYTKGKDIAAACGQLALKEATAPSQLAVIA